MTTVYTMEGKDILKPFRLSASRRNDFFTTTTTTPPPPPFSRDRLSSLFRANTENHLLVQLKTKIIFQIHR
jgi:hypothetical protein